MSDEIRPNDDLRPVRNLRTRNRQNQAPSSVESAAIEMDDQEDQIVASDRNRLEEHGAAETMGVEEASLANDDDESEWIIHNRHRGGGSTPQQQPPSISLNRRISKKRTYRYIKRVCKPKKVSKMRTTWLEILQQPDEELKSLVCCSRKCFSVLNISFLREKMLQFLSSSLTDRRKALFSMATSSGEFVFDGVSVCGEFLRKGFRFSLEMQAAARRLPVIESATISNEIMDYTQSVTTERSVRSSSGRSHSSLLGAYTMPSLSFDSILTFIDRISDDTAERMPDNGELHLPFFRKEDVYELFTSEYKKLYPDRIPPSPSYFYSTWQKNRSKVKVRQETRFTKCGTCERLRSALANAIRKGLPTDDIKKEKADHNEFIALERREYLRKAELAILRPSKYMSFVVDGADQSAFTLPHFVTKVKESRGEGMKIHLIGLLQHLSLNRLNLYSMTDDHQTGANHIVECIHRYINDVSREGSMPRILFVQLDNCTRENKNHYLLSYIEALVLWNVFDSVEVGFLPVGHTHTDIDQSFSATSDRLKHHDAITLADMHHQLSLCYNEKTVISTMKQVVNWSGLCDKSGCNNNVNLITQYRYFRFSRSNRTSQNGLVNSVCHVRSSCTQDWRSLESESGNGVTGILKFLPDLSQTPPEKIVCPAGVDKVEKKLDSESGRIMTQVKMRSLVALKNEVFRSKTLKFHWNLPSIIETTASTQGLNGGDDESNVVQEAQSTGNVTSSGSYRYDQGSFVAVNTGNSGQGQEFWIGEIVDCHKARGNQIVSISVLWYQYYGCSNIYNGRYKPHMRLTPKSKKKDTPWIDKIGTDTILVSFPKLTSDKRIPASVSNYLREHFSSKVKTALN